MVEFDPNESKDRDKQVWGYSNTLGVDIPLDTNIANTEDVLNVTESFRNMMKDDLGDWSVNVFNEMAQILWTSVRAPDKTMFYFMDNAHIDIPQADLRELKALDIEKDDDMYRVMEYVDDKTTKIINETFGDITLYRGLAYEISDQLEMAKYRGESYKYRHKFLEPWTSNRGMAELFAITNVEDKDNGVVIESIVQPEEIFITSHITGRDVEESEFLVMYLDESSRIPPESISVVGDSKTIEDAKREYNL